MPGLATDLYIIKSFDYDAIRKHCDDWAYYDTDIDFDGLNKNLGLIIDKSIYTHKENNYIELEHNFKVGHHVNSKDEVYYCRLLEKFVEMELVFTV